MALRTIVEEQAKKYDSFYLYDESCILESIRRLKENFPSIDFLYSVKSNPHPYILNTVFSSGFGADAASLGEVLKAEGAGLAKERIYYSAPGKTMADIEGSIDKAVIIADSINEIERIQQVAGKKGLHINIGIRINPEFSFSGGSGLPSKFGVDEGQALDFIKNNSCPNIKITGIHVHLRSQELNASVLADYYKKMFSLAEKFQSICGNLEYVNMGSGMGIQYSLDDAPLDIAQLSSVIKEELAAFPYPETKIIIETGRYVSGKSGVYVTKVLDRKVSCGKTYIILKNTLNGFCRPSLVKMVENYSQEKQPGAYEPLFTAKDAFQLLPLNDSKPLETVTLVGNLCTATDIIAEDIIMPRLDCGDCLVITNAGSYAAVITPMQFASQEEPAELFLTASGEVKTGAVALRD